MIIASGAFHAERLLLEERNLHEFVFTALPSTIIPIY
jgi:hypothetical protein